MSVRFLRPGATGLSIGSGNVSFTSSSGITFSFMGGTMPSGAALTRSSTGWYTDSAGVLQSAANDVARFTYNPSGLALQGLLNEASATNSNRNSNASGMVAGNPGTPPTNWTITVPANNVARNIVGTGTEDGIPYIEIQWNGTPSLTGSVVTIFETTTGIVAAQGQTWVESNWLRLTAGSLTGLASPPNLVANIIQERTAAGGGLGGGGQSNVGPTSAALRTQRYNLTATLSNATTGRVTGAMQFGYTNGVAIDLTLRIGMPHMCQLAAAGSPIITTGAAAVTRNLDTLTLSPPAGTYNISITRLSGVTNVGSTVVGGGGYVVPNDVSPVQSVLFA